MPESTPLRLVDPEAERGDTIPLERRRSMRRRVAQHVTAVLRSDEVPEGGGRIGSMHLRDMSQTGIGAFSPRFLPLETEVTLFFPPHGSERGFDLHGKVVRCEHDEDGYDVGIQITGLPQMNVA